MPACAHDKEKPVYFRQDLKVGTLDVSSFTTATDYICYTSQN